MTEYTLTALPATLPGDGRVVALGLFDGVHLGHRAVMTAATDLLDPAAGRSRLSVFTLTGLAKGMRLTEAEEERRRLSLAGVDEVIAVAFAAIRNLSPAAFVTDFLRDTLHASAVVCGEDFRFGKDRAGDAAALKTLCEALSIAVRVVPPVTEAGEPVSTSRIRRCLEEGQIVTANRLLGDPFTLRFPVTEGQKLGHTLGFPTLNQVLPPDFVRPRFGVYASLAEIAGHRWLGVTNIGVHPTVGETSPVAETWLPDFSGDLYGKTVPVTLLRFLRPEQKFASLSALETQVKADGAAARQAVFGDPASKEIKAVFFDFDDTLQDRHAAFLAYARWFMRRYFPTLPEKERERRAAWLLKANNGGYGADGTALDYPAFFHDLTTRWTDGVAMPDGMALLREYRRRFPACTRLFPDTVETIRTLRSAGLTVGVITNGDAVMQMQKLDYSGLRTLLDVTVVSGVFEVHKPDRRLYELAAALAGAAPAQCLMVGDHPVNDIAGARNAGMHTAYLDAFEARAAVEGPRIERPSEVLSLLGLSAPKETEGPG